MVAVMVTVVLLLLTCFTATPVFGEESIVVLGGNTLYVDDDGGGDYTRIQDAVDNATIGDTVFVYNGTYYENVVVDKSINLTGEDKETAIINGSGVGDVVYVSADGVKISGFTIQNGGDALSYDNFDAGIDLHSSDNIVFDNIICLNRNSGICISYPSESSSFTSNNTVSFNIIDMNNNDGIMVIDSYSNKISDNIIESNKNRGIYLYSVQNIISNNTISKNGCGIKLHTESNIISNNIISDNVIGINFGRSGRLNDILENSISDNDYGILTEKPEDLSDTKLTNYIYHNNFINNDNNVYYYKNNQWDSNYWDKWIGVKHPLLRFLPYRIPGAPLKVGSGIIPFLSLYFNFDWNPAKEPYDIPGMGGVN
jgi:parallel beta-helix repeat protein